MWKSRLTKIFFLVIFIGNYHYFAEEFAMNKRSFANRQVLSALQQDYLPKLNFNNSDNFRITGIRDNRGSLTGLRVQTGWSELERSLISYSVLFNQDNEWIVETDYPVKFANKSSAPKRLKRKSSGDKFSAESDVAKKIYEVISKWDVKASLNG